MNTGDEAIEDHQPSMQAGVDPESAGAPADRAGHARGLLGHATEPIRRLSIRLLIFFIILSAALVAAAKLGWMEEASIRFWMGLVADFVKGTAWPIVATLGLIVFRRPISAKLAQLKRASGGGVGLEWGDSEQEVAEAQELMNEATGSSSVGDKAALEEAASAVASAADGAFRHSSAHVGEAVEDAWPQPAADASVELVYKSLRMRLQAMAYNIPHAVRTESFQYSTVEARNQLRVLAQDAAFVARVCRGSSVGGNFSVHKCFAVVYGDQEARAGALSLYHSLLRMGRKIDESSAAVPEHVVNTFNQACRDYREKIMNATLAILSSPPDDRLIAITHAVVQEAQQIRQRADFARTAE